MKQPGNEAYVNNNLALAELSGDEQCGEGSETHAGPEQEVLSMEGKISKIFLRAFPSSLEQ
ncbi:hypothetical protein KR51_00008390 [Rubidibacter lacunae KORDI 51-2]|uniref:Uncharacterized protein n=1 Tax=Rubidibacter lacunae KORDI 51-2 TaxID=582515 RepID=U5DLH1_9CHRO|nr:hypothetical protein KR51_00008390 [Rubidibacter lacunae KORDI 51-2]